MRAWKTSTQCGSNVVTDYKTHGKGGGKGKGKGGGVGGTGSWNGEFGTKMYPHFFLDVCRRSMQSCNGFENIKARFLAQVPRFLRENRSKTRCRSVVESEWVSFSLPLC